MSVEIYVEEDGGEKREESRERMEEERRRDEEEEEEERVRGGEGARSMSVRSLALYSRRTPHTHTHALEEEERVGPRGSVSVGCSLQFGVFTHCHPVL